MRQQAIEGKGPLGACAAGRYYKFARSTGLAPDLNLAEPDWPQRRGPGCRALQDPRQGQRWAAGRSAQAAGVKACL